MTSATRPERRKIAGRIVTAALVVLGMTTVGVVAVVTGSQTSNGSQVDDSIDIHTFANGDYVVGTTITAGQYRAEVEAAGSDWCEVSQIAADGTSVADTRNAAEGSVIFTVEDVAGSVVSFSGCGTIALASDVLRTNPGELTNGDWLVGTEIPAGQYEGTIDPDAIVNVGNITHYTRGGSIVSMQSLIGNGTKVTLIVRDITGSTVNFYNLTDIHLIG